MTDNVVPADELDKRRMQRAREIAEGMTHGDATYIEVDGIEFDSDGQIVFNAGTIAVNEDKLLGAVSDLLGRVHQLETALRQIIKAESLLYNNSVAKDIALSVLGDDDE